MGVKFTYCSTVKVWLAFPRNTCLNTLARPTRSPFFMHDFHSMPRVGIQQVPLKSYRRWDSTCDRMMAIGRIDEPLAPLDSQHRDSARVALYSRSMDKGSFFCQFWKLGFCLVSECEIFAHRGQLEGDCRSSPLEKILVANYYSMCIC